MTAPALGRSPLQGGRPMIASIKCPKPKTRTPVPRTPRFWRCFLQFADRPRSRFARSPLNFATISFKRSSPTASPLMPGWSNSAKKTSPFLRRSAYPNLGAVDCSSSSCCAFRSAAHSVPFVTKSPASGARESSRRCSRDGFLRAYSGKHFSGRTNCRLAAAITATDSHTSERPACANMAACSCYPFLDHRAQF